MRYTKSLESVIREALRVAAFDDDDYLARDIAAQVEAAGYVNQAEIERWRRTIVIDMTDKEHERTPSNAPTHCIEAWCPGRVISDETVAIGAAVSLTEQGADE